MGVAVGRRGKHSAGRKGRCRRRPHLVVGRVAELVRVDALGRELAADRRIVGRTGPAIHLARHLAAVALLGVQLALHRLLVQLVKPRPFGVGTRGPQGRPALGAGGDDGRGGCGGFQAARLLLMLCVPLGSGLPAEEPQLEACMLHDAQQLELRNLATLRPT